MTKFNKDRKAAPLSWMKWYSGRGDKLPACQPIRFDYTKRYRMSQHASNGQASRNVDEQTSWQLVATVPRSLAIDRWLA